MHNFSPGNIRSVFFDIFDRFVFVKFTMRSLLFHTIVVWMLLFGRALCVNVQCMILLPINHKKQINPIQCVIFVQTPSDLSGTLPQSWRKNKPNVLIKMSILIKCSIYRHLINIVRGLGYLCWAGVGANAL